MTFLEMTDIRCVSIYLSFDSVSDIFDPKLPTAKSYKHPLQ